MLTLALTMALAQTPQHRLFLQPNLPRVDYAFFELAPASGAGMGAPCACAAITGAKGEAVTFTRGSTATCSKQGLATTGIANGDLVDCSSNLPRVELSSGVAGLRVEGSRENLAVRNEELDNASWLLASGGAPNPGNPVRTANAGVAPDGTTTAEQLDFASTTGTGFGVIYQGPFLSTVASYTASVYVRGVSGPGTIYLMSTDGTTYRTSACAFVSTSWARCTVTGAETAVNWFLQIGFDLRDGAQTGQGAQSVYLWRPQRELAAVASSPIETVAAAVTRSAESGYSVLTSDPASVAGTVEVPYVTSTTNRRIVNASNAGATQSLEVFFATATARVDSFVINGAFLQQTGTVAAIPGVVRAVAAHVSATTLSTIVNGTTTTSATTVVTPTPGRVYFGAYAAAGGFEADGIVTRVCVDPSPTRCR